MRSILIICAIFAGLALSFLGFGLMWIGVPLLAQGVALAFLFFLLTFFIGKALGSFQMAFCLPAMGALPLASLLARFRDPEGSHLGPVLLVVAWALGALAGAWLGTRPPETLIRTPRI